jgi:hypothetical protein
MSTNTPKKTETYNTKAQELFNDASSEVDDVTMESSSTKQQAMTPQKHGKVLNQALCQGVEWVVHAEAAQEVL